TDCCQFVVLEEKRQLTDFLFIINENPNGTFNTLKDKKGHISINKSLQDLTDKVTTLNNKLDQIANHLETVEGRVGTVENNCEKVDNEVECLKKDFKKLIDKCEDLEAWSRRSNIRIVGLPEGIERRNPVQLCETFLSHLVGPEHFPKGLEIERVHRMPKPKPNPGEKPRVVIVRLLRYNNREAILRKAREKGSLSYNNQPMFIFPDLTIEVQKKCREFDDPQKLYKALSIKFALLYSACLHLEI
uniref:L1 transposable element RRM domain-containing protein n=1 Tax=Latimeria chalumnae TaxID=7897 RepID=H3AR91_LATCH